MVRIGDLPSAYWCTGQFFSGFLNCAVTSFVCSNIVQDIFGTCFAKIHTHFCDDFMSVFRLRYSILLSPKSTVGGIFRDSLRRYFVSSLDNRSVRPQNLGSQRDSRVMYASTSPYSSGYISPCLGPCMRVSWLETWLPDSNLYHLYHFLAVCPGEAS